VTIDQPLVPGGQLTALDADRLELIDLLGDGQERADRAEGLSAEIHIGASQDQA
jgi:hypothetical protein